MSETLYKKNKKGRYVPVAQSELYNLKRYDFGIYLVFSREGCVSTLRLKESEVNTIDILHECIKKSSVEFLSKIVNDAHENVCKKEKNGIYYVPADWYEEIAKLLLQSVDKDSSK